jgi:multiple sugar transport system ATP-binding protein
MASIAFSGVSKVFPDGTVAVDGLDLDIPDGGFTALVGPSGSGKSTALRMVAGLEDTTAGTIRIADRVVNDVAPKDRDIAMVFQSYALYPHMSVEDNLGFALKLRSLDQSRVRTRVAAVARRLGIGEQLARRPRQLSGGQRQRVALGRAIVREPRAFLMDEPLSNLDAKLRVEMRAYIARLHQELGTTTLYVTHDQTEAMTMADRVAVMRDGRLEQVAAPQVLYDRPSNLFVAAFIGSPAMNLLRGRLELADGRLHALLGSGRLVIPDALLDAWPEPGRSIDRQVVIGIRPEAVYLADGDARAGHLLELEVVHRRAARDGLRRLRRGRRGRAGGSLHRSPRARPADRGGRPPAARRRRRAAARLRSADGRGAALTRRPRPLALSARSSARR